MTTPFARYKASLKRRYQCAWCHRRVVQPAGPPALYCPKAVRPCKEQAHSARRREQRQLAQSFGPPLPPPEGVKP